MYNCKISNKCGNCKYLNKEYSETLKIKLTEVNRLLKNGSIDYVVKDIVASPKEIGYRNKMIVAFKMVKNQIVCGFYEEASHKVVPIDYCLMHSDEQNKLIHSFIELMKKFRYTPYDEDKRIGMIRYLLIKESHITKELMLVIVTATEQFYSSNEFCRRLKDNIPTIKTIIQNINGRKTSVVLGEKERILYGNGHISDMLCNLKFQITSKSFFQVNPLQAENIYFYVKDLCKKYDNNIILDAYSGVGTIGMIVSDSANKVISVENNKQAHISAINNAKYNNIKNVSFVNEDATKYIKYLAANNKMIDTIIMDPPRAGSTLEFIQACSILKPNIVIYVSCCPETLVRDLIQFKKYNYQVKNMKCFDMFCFSDSIETVVQLASKTYQG